MVGPNPKRRDPTAHAAILEAAWQELTEKGYARLTVEGIAKRAGAGKQTVYRWWPSKEAVLLEAINSRTATTLEFPDTGDVVADLGAHIGEVAEFLNSDLVIAYRALLAASQFDPELAEQVERAIVQPRTDACVRRLKKAQADGQLRLDIDPLDVLEMLYGPLYYRLILQTRPISIADARAHVRYVFDGLQAPP